MPARARDSRSQLRMRYYRRRHSYPAPRPVTPAERMVLACFYEMPSHQLQIVFSEWRGGSGTPCGLSRSDAGMVGSCVLDASLRPIATLGMDVRARYCLHPHGHGQRRPGPSW